jgi:hypothetical protein
MASSSSSSKGKMPVEWTSSLVDTGTSIKTDRVDTLKGCENYQTWETQVSYLLESIDADEIVMENLQLPKDATVEESKIYKKIYNNALAILVQTLSPEILAFCIHLVYPNEKSHPFFLKQEIYLTDPYIEVNIIRA